MRDLQNHFHVLIAWKFGTIHALIWHSAGGIHAGRSRRGLSGPPLQDRALAVLRRLRARTGDRLVLIAVGGIETPDDAWERLRAGATLVQAYTGFIYGGPLWPRHIHTGLARRARASGLTSIGDCAAREASAGDAGPPTSV